MDKRNPKALHCFTMGIRPTLISAVQKSPLHILPPHLEVDLKLKYNGLNAHQCSKQKRERSRSHNGAGLGMPRTSARPEVTNPKCPEWSYVVHSTPTPLIITKSTSEWLCRTRFAFRGDPLSVWKSNKEKFSDFCFVFCLSVSHP